jgi:predicted esterase
MDPRLKYPLPENIVEHSIEISRKARWFHVGEVPQDGKEVIIVLHGYGQHPAYMLNGLRELEREGRSICAPEGLSRFYVEGFDGKIGASWMTRDDRENEMNDYLSYLNKWWSSLHIDEAVSVTLIGFSQGVATAARWLSDGMKVDKVIFSSGTLPVEWNQQKPRLDKRISEIHIVRPKEDEYYSLDVHEKEVEGLRKFGFNVMSHKPNGTHKLSSAVINEIL